MIRLRQIAERCTLKQVALFGIMLSVAMFVINGGWIGVGRFVEITDGVNILDFEFGYSAGEAYNRLEAMRNAGREYYLTRIIPMDFVFPVCYALVYASAIGWCLKKLSPKGNVMYLLMVVPMAAMLFDWLENACIILLLINYPSQITVLAVGSSIITITKFLLIYFCWAVITVLLAALAGKMIKRKL